MTESDPGVAAADGAEARRKTSLYAAVVGGVVLVDQATKYVVEQSMTLYQNIPVVEPYFRLTFIYNPGAAFGLHVGGWSRFFFLGLAVVAVVALWFLFRATPWADRARLFAIAGVTGGAIGNMIDRMRSSRGVVDFLDFGLQPDQWRWPVFNVADIFVTCGALVLAYSLWREEQREGKDAPAEDAG